MSELSNKFVCAQNLQSSKEYKEIYSCNRTYSLAKQVFVSRLQNGSSKHRPHLHPFKHLAGFAPWIPEKLF